MNTFPLAADMKARWEPNSRAAAPRARSRRNRRRSPVPFTARGSEVLGAALKTTSLYKAVAPITAGSPEEDRAIDAGRLIGVGILPPTQDVADSIEEMEYATAGLKTVFVQGFPSGKPYPSKEDDPFWTAALAENAAQRLRRSRPSEERAGQLFKYPQESDELMKKLTHDLVDQVGRFGPVRGNGSVRGSVGAVGVVRSLSQPADLLRRKSDRVDSVFCDSGCGYGTWHVR